MDLLKITNNHNHVFLLDAVGATISIFLLLFVLVPYGNFFGLSSSTLINLSIPIFGLLLFSMLCFFLKPQNWKLFMKLLALGNLVYCLFTSLIILLNFKELTIWGVVYFLIEIVLILFIVSIEMATVRK